MTSWQITFVLLVNLGLFPYSPKIDPMVFVIIHYGYFCQFVEFNIYSQPKKGTPNINSVLLKGGYSELRKHTHAATLLSNDYVKKEV